MPRDARGMTAEPRDVPCARGKHIPREVRTTRAALGVACARGRNVPRDVGTTRAALGVASARGMNAPREALTPSARGMRCPGEIGAASEALGSASARGMSVPGEALPPSARGMSVPREVGSFWLARGRATTTIPPAPSSPGRGLNRKIGRSGGLLPCPSSFRSSCEFPRSPRPSHPSPNVARFTKRPSPFFPL